MPRLREAPFLGRIVGKKTPHLSARTSIGTDALGHLGPACRFGLFALVLGASHLLGQAPEGWTSRSVLGVEVPLGTAWVGGGVWAAHQSGPPATLIDSLGLGNSLTGAGVSVEGGISQGAWSFALKALAFRDADGGNRLTLHQGHLTWHSRGGWKLGLEDEPLVWGYGLTGGYLLGEAARPFPRFRMESPGTQLSLFGQSLGTWGLQWFTGRLESRRRFADNAQDPSSRARLIERYGDPQAPLLSGYRVEGSFLERKIECYVNWTVLWGGTRRGTSMTSGYGLGEYLTAMSGLKDPLVETSTDFSDPNHPTPQLRNRAESSTNFDLGMRFQIPALATLFSAERAWGYVSRGSKGMTLGWGQLVKKPIYWLGKDLEHDARYALQADFRRAWYNVDHHVVPNLIVPNDAFGLLIQWPRIRLGVERRSTSNLPEVGYRSFVNTIYLTGFYRDGDPLGEALGGETDTTSLRLEYDLSSRLSATVWFIRGARPFRDNPALWVADHPGAAWTEDRFTGLQGDVAWKVDAARTFRAGWAWEGHSAAGYILGNKGNGFRWFAELSARWFR